MICPECSGQTDYDPGFVGNDDEPESLNREYCLECDWEQVYSKWQRMVYEADARYD